MKHIIGRIVCFLLRSHAWRRLRKAERTVRSAFPEHERICSRCGLVRSVKSRKAEA